MTHLSIAKVRPTRATIVLHAQLYLDVRNSRELIHVNNPEGKRLERLFTSKILGSNVNTATLYFGYELTDLLKSVDCLFSDVSEKVATINVFKFIVFFLY